MSGLGLDQYETTVNLRLLIENSISVNLPDDIKVISSGKTHSLSNQYVKS